MDRPRHQRLLLYAAWLLGGIIALGSLMDAVSNSIALVTPRVAIAVTVAVVAMWLVVEVLTTALGVEWRQRGGQLVVLRHIGWQVRLPLIGVIALLWLPTFAHHAGLGRQELHPRQRYAAVIDSALEATRTSLFSIHERIEMAEAVKNAKVPSPAPYGLGPLNLPSVLAVVQTNGDLYTQASPSMRSRLPHFVNSLRTYESAFSDKYDTSTNLGTLRMLRWELRAQERCLVIEQAYLRGTYDLKEHERRFSDVLDTQVRDLLSGRF